MKLHPAYTFRIISCWDHPTFQARLVMQQVVIDAEFHQGYNFTIMKRRVAALLRMIRNPRRMVRLFDSQFFIDNGQKSVWGSVTEEDEQELIRLTKLAATIPGPIIEIGALFGFTTQLIATYKPADKQLIAVENFAWNPFGIPSDDHRTIMRRVLRYNMAHNNTSVFEGSSQDFYKQYRGDTPAMIFIDAGHTYEEVKLDIEWAVRQSIPLIVGHDYNEIWPGVRRAVDEAFGGQISVRGNVWSHSKPSSSSIDTEVHSYA